MRENTSEEQGEEEVREVPAPIAIFEEEIGLGILFTTLAVALVITVVGITIPLVEAGQVSADSEYVQQQHKEAVMLKAHKAIKSDIENLQLDVQALERKVHDIEMELKAGGGGP